ncbi:MAG TPA: ATP-grasp domain-containing protein [Pirellulales bacterium]|nr:ATP-grasp domain-containing protein [Pirellulales bacterium]
MRILLYEFVTGGGWHAFSTPPPASLLAEGAAMLGALAADFVALGGVSVEVLQDSRWGQFAPAGCTVHRVSSTVEEQELLRRVSAACDWTVLIAPEFDGLLHARTVAVERSGGRLLSPGSALVGLATDKHATAEHLSRHGVRVPRGVALAPYSPLPSDFGYPAVLKPRDGAGSQGIELIAAPAADRVIGRSACRLEQLCVGTPASVALLCGVDQRVSLPPCRQTLRSDGDFTYLGGALPLEPGLARRATRLAAQAVQCLPRPFGYLGVDVVLGHDPDGAEDYAIEVNPRITTSYVGLRALAAENLAAG